MSEEIEEGIETVVHKVKQPQDWRGILCFAGLMAVELGAICLAADWLHKKGKENQDVSRAR